ncbi:dynein light chain, putative [Ixodes scapularis]|uniref:Dynein light chain 1, cytoplasmic n=1 Tax=Ixodes scapularis TaxID=6945 RepID=B7PF98_IXOSC|nr:dynein light chain, putative [Ixodes scapularis]|eukprot:XP_002433870.1 dynein light chain, putative [Ixodes scapularis]
MPPTFVPLSTELIPGLDWRPLCFEHPLPLDRLCHVCGVLCKETVVLPCSHTLCDVCFEGSLDLGCVCPLDRKNFDKDAVDKLKLRPGQLLKLSVSCWNSAHGCNFIGPVSELLDHFEKECLHHRASCPRCHQDVPRLGLVQHCVQCYDPKQGAEAPLQSATLQGVQLREDLEKASAEIKQSMAELKDGYYVLQASVNTVANEVNLGHSVASQAITEAVSGLLQQLQKTQPDMTKLGRELCGTFENATADMKQSISELKDGYSRLHASVNAVLDELKLGHSEGDQAIVETMSNLLAQFQKMQPDATHRQGQLLEDLRRSCAEIKQSIADLKNDFSRPQTSIGAFKDDVKLEHSEKRMSTKQAVMHFVKMPRDMQQDAVRIAIQALEKFQRGKDIAFYIQDKFREKYDPFWQCIVGTNFDSYVHYRIRCHIDFQLGHMRILLFKALGSAKAISTGSSMEISVGGYGLSFQDECCEYGHPDEDFDWS